MVYICITNCAFKHTAQHAIHRYHTPLSTTVCALFFCLPLTFTSRQHWHPSTYRKSCTFSDLFSKKHKQTFISPVTQICCDVNSCPDRSRYSATQPNRRSEGINKFTFGLCAEARLQFRSSLGWSAKLTAVSHHKNRHLCIKQCSLASQTFL